MHSFALLWKGVNTAITLDHPTVHCLVEMASLAVLLQSPCVGGLHHTNQKNDNQTLSSLVCLALSTPSLKKSELDNHG